MSSLKKEVVKIKPSFRLHHERDRDIIEALQQIPERQRSEHIKKWIRKGLSINTSTEKKSKIIKWSFPESKVKD